MWKQQQVHKDKKGGLNMHHDKGGLAVDDGQMIASTAHLDQPPEQVETGYLEYRRACYDVMRRHAAHSGVFDALKQSRSAQELSEQMQFHPNRLPIVAMLLAALHRSGALEQVDDKYTVTAQAFADATFDHELLGQAIGHDKIEELIHSDSYSGLVDVLGNDSNFVATPFTSDHLDLWYEFLETPFYRYFRRSAVAATSYEGGRSVDLACGLGHGLLEHAEIIGTDGAVIGVERSHHFAKECLDRTVDFPAIHLVQGDLDSGVPFLRDGFFDGVTLVGAYHFLKKRELLLAESRRVLREGGKLSLAYVYEKRGSFDQELMDLRFAMREPKAYATTETELVDLATTVGFDVTDSWHIGCFGFYVLEAR